MGVLRDEILQKFLLNGRKLQELCRLLQANLTFYPNHRVSTVGMKASLIEIGLTLHISDLSTRAKS